MACQWCDAEFHADRESCPGEPRARTVGDVVKVTLQPGTARDIGISVERAR